MLTLLVLLGLSCSALGQLSGSSPPPAGACICMSFDAVNVRDSGCGNVIGSANTGACFTYSGTWVGCTLDQYYEFFNFDYYGSSGWAAGNYMYQASDSMCSGGSSGEGYTCDVVDQGMRIHETTSPTPYDCIDSACGNTCQGGQCVAYVTCRCTAPGTANHVPNTSCWRPGTPLMGGDGKCNRAIAANTAIATFSGGYYYAGHAAVFVACQDDYTILTYDQWCCRSIGYSTYGSGHEFFSTFAVITNPGVCADRTSWDCRLEGAGPTCCPTYVDGCQANHGYLGPYLDDINH